MRIRDGISIRDEQPGSYFRELRNNFFGLKYLNSLMQSGMEKLGSGMGIRNTEKKGYSSNLW
jgi:hypothetical protein